MSDVVETITVNAADAPSQINAVTEANQNLASSTADVGASSSTNYGSMEANIGRTSVMGLVMLDRLDIAQTAVENAQIRGTLAQQRYSDAVAKFGPASEQATRAHKEMEIAMNAVGIAQQREEVRFAIMAGITIPQMIRGVYNLIPALQEWTVNNGILELSTVNLTRAQMALLATSVVGIPMLIAGLAFMGALGGAAGSNVNVYGDVNMSSATSPGGFGTATTAWAQQVR